VLNCEEHACSLSSRNLGFNRQKTNGPEISSIFSPKMTLTNQVLFSEETLVSGVVLEQQKISLSSNCGSDSSCCFGFNVSTTQTLRPSEFTDTPNNLLAAIFHSSNQCHIFRKSISLHSRPKWQENIKTELKRQGVRDRITGFSDFFPSSGILESSFTIFRYSRRF
jgi:hypothetical protein